jgi:outer membrane protein OmpA-like peptidoglycan-associated protein
MDELGEIFESRKAGASHEDQWISLSDLMSSLMMIFMLLAVAFMLKIEADSTKRIENTVKIEEEAKRIAKESLEIQAKSKELEQKAKEIAEYAAKIEADFAKMQQVAVLYDQVKSEIYHELTKEFEKDLPAWGAAITKDLSIQFKNETVLFDRGKSDVKPSFQAILQDFFPRYLKILTSPQFSGSIQEVRIEGHTSSVWGANTPQEEAYFKNMELSQARTRSTLNYLMSLPQVQPASQWLRQYVTANGLSSSHPILNADGTENEGLSQRVEFRIRTDAEAKINAILQSVH